MGVRWWPLAFFMTQLFLHSQITVSAQHATVPQFGQCQAQCLSEYSNRRDRRLLNGDTVLNEIDVTNNTQFSLCKLGCTSPGFDELGLPAFIEGQNTIKRLITKTDEVIPLTIVSRIAFLCADFSFSNHSITSQIELQLTNGTHENYVHFVEAFYRSSFEYKREISFWSQFFYSSSVEMHTILPTDLESFQLRVTTFSLRGIMGNTVKSAWIGRKLVETSLSTEVKVGIKKQIWLDEQASVELFFYSAQGTLPVCSLTIAYDQHLNDAVKEIKMDRSMGYLLDGLQFEQEYKVVVYPTVRGSQDTSSAKVKETVVRTESCRRLAQDLNLCAPPAVESITLIWTAADTAVLNWTYGADSVEPLGTQYPRMVHFSIVMRSISTPGYEQCQHVAEQKRSVTGTHRAVIFYVTDHTCNYEVEITVVDTRNRRSPPKKSQFIRYQQTSSLIIGAGASDWVQLALIAIMVAVILISASAAVIVCVKTRRLSSLEKDFGKNLKANVVIGTIRHDSKGAPYDETWCQMGTRQIIGLRGVYSDSDEESQRSQRLAWPDRARPKNGTIPRPPSGDPPNIHYYTTSHATQSVRRSERGQNSMIEQIAHKNDAPMDQDGYTFCLDARPNDQSIPDFRCSMIEMVVDSVPRILRTDLTARAYLGFGKYGVATLVSIKDKDYGYAVLKEHFEGSSAETHLSREALKRELASTQALCRKERMECVVELLGVVTILDCKANEQVSGLLFEHCAGGDLNGFLMVCAKKEQNQLLAVHGTTNTYEEVYMCSGALQQRTLGVFLMQCVYDISCALNFLADLNYVHRDIAARNVMLHLQWTDPYVQPIGQRAKLGDFGLCEQAKRDSMQHDDSNALLPSDILPPETFDHFSYSLPGDVWQFGCLVAEICSLGRPCFLKTQNKDGRNERIKDFVKGITSTQKELDSQLVEVLRPLIQKCLNVQPSKRPIMIDLVLELEQYVPLQVHSTESEFV